MNLINSLMIFFLVVVALAITGVILYSIREKKIQKRLDELIMDRFHARYPKCPDCGQTKFYIKDEISVLRTFKQMGWANLYQSGENLSMAYDRWVSEIKHKAKLMCKGCGREIYHFTSEKMLSDDNTNPAIESDGYFLSKTEEGLPCYNFKPIKKRIETIDLVYAKDVKKVLEMDQSFLPLSKAE